MAKIAQNLGTLIGRNLVGSGWDTAQGRQAGWGNSQVYLALSQILRAFDRTSLITR